LFFFETQCRNQLLAEACVQIRRRDGGTTTSLDLHNVESSNEENAADKPVTQPLAKKAKYTQKAEEVEQAKISTQKSQPKSTTCRVSTELGQEGLQRSAWRGKVSMESCVT